MSRLTRPVALVAIFAFCWTVVFCPTLLVIQGRWLDLLILVTTTSLVLNVAAFAMVRDGAREVEGLEATVAQAIEELHQTRRARGVSDQQLARAVIAPADRSDPGECRNFRACTETRRLLDEANAKWIARQALVAPQESGL